MKHNRGIVPRSVMPLVTAIATALGCRSESAPAGSQPSARSVDDIPSLATMAYACDDGTTVVAHLRPAGSVFLFLPDETVELPRVPSASGTKFSDDSTIYWSKGAEATIIRPEGASVVCQEQRGRSIIEDAKLRGVDYWATGNEPGWTLEIAADSIRFVTGYGTEHYRFATPEPLVDEDGHGVEYAASANDHRLTVTIKYLRCGDSMSGTQFEGMVRLVFDDHELPGCGQALH